MKQTPLKRTTELKRTGFKRKPRKALNKVSKTNNHPERNSKLRQTYAERNPLCEACFYLFHRTPRTSTETHHLFGGNKGRADLWSNLLRGCWECHRLLEHWKEEGRVIALLLKARKGEVDPAEIYQASGKHLGWWVEYCPTNETLAVIAQAELQIIFGKELEMYVGVNDDYAHLETNKAEFYYGYEVTEPPQGEGDEDTEREWCFTATIGKERVMCLPKSKLAVPSRCGDGTEVYLLAGMAHFIDKYLP